MTPLRIHLKKHWDFWLFVVILLGINFPLLLGKSSEIFSFYPGLVREGQWWRALTFLFAHISRFHFFLDSVPFLILYITLEEKNPLWRIFYFLMAAAGNIVAVIFFAPQVNVIGVRGLSGVTYGILTVSALELAFRPRKEKLIRLAGAASLIFIAWLVLYETLKQRFPFEFLLLGSVGIPVFACHAGGVTASVLAFFFRRLLKQNRSRGKSSGFPLSRE